jgi:hypothetical protein
MEIVTFVDDLSLDVDSIVFESSVAICEGTKVAASVLVVVLLALLLTIVL